MKKLRKAIKTNPRRLPCVIPGTEQTGWSWLLMTEAQWDTVQKTILAAETTTAEDTPGQQNTQPEEGTEEGTTAEGTTAKKKKARKCSKVTDPMKFDSTQKRTDEQCSAAWAEHQQDLALFQCKTNLLQGCLQDPEQAMPSGLIADLCDEDDELPLSVTPSSLLRHMEDLCDILKPCDIREVTGAVPESRGLQNQVLPLRSHALQFMHCKKCKDASKNKMPWLAEIARARSWVQTPAGEGNFCFVSHLTRLC